MEPEIFQSTELEMRKGDRQLGFIFTITTPFTSKILIHASIFYIRTDVVTQQQCVQLSIEISFPLNENLNNVQISKYFSPDETNFKYLEIVVKLNFILHI